MMLRSLFTALTVLALLVGGVALGMAIDRVLIRAGSSWRPPVSGGPTPERIATVLKLRLGLTDAQRAAVEEIVRFEQSEAARITAGVRPELDESFRRTRGRIRDMLTPDQLGRFDDMMGASAPPMFQAPDGGLP